MPLNLQGPGAAGLTVPISVLLWGAKADGANLSAVHCSIPLMVFFGCVRRLAFGVGHVEKTRG